MTNTSASLRIQTSKTLQKEWPESSAWEIQVAELEAAINSENSTGCEEAEIYN